MYPVSVKFKETVRQSHQMILRVEVWRDGVQVAELFPTDGMVEVDARRTHRRTCQLLLPATDGLVPGVNPADLSPYGNELAIWRGIRYVDDGIEYDEWVPQGVFLITELDVASSAGASLVVRGVDRSLRISRSKWTAVYRTTADDTLEEVLDEMLRSRWPKVETDFGSTGVTVPRRVFGLETTNDPWEDARGIALSGGFDLFFDQSGVAVLQPTLAYESMAPLETYIENDEAMVLSVSRGLTSERSFNGAIVTGEGTRQNQVFRGEAWDDDPASPTYRFGLYGRYPQFYSSSSIRSDDQAQAAAEQLVNKSKGLVETFEWVQIVDPSLDAGDYIRVRNGLANVDRSFVIDRLTLPLAASQSMSCIARTLRIDGRFDEELTA